MGLLKRGSAYLARALRDDDAESVSLTRGVQTTTGVSAVIGNTPFEVDEGDGASLTIVAVDWLIARSAYRIGGTVVDPAAGDLIVLERDDETLTYEVLPFGSEPCFRTSDAYGNELRVHSKLKGSEPVV